MSKVPDKNKATIFALGRMLTAINHGRATGQYGSAHEVFYIREIAACSLILAGAEGKLEWENAWPLAMAELLDEQMRSDYEALNVDMSIHRRR